MSNEKVIQNDPKFNSSSKLLKSSKFCKNKQLKVDFTPDSSRKPLRASKNKTLSVDNTPDSSRRIGKGLGKQIIYKNGRDSKPQNNGSLDLDVTPKSSKVEEEYKNRKSCSKITNKGSLLDVDVTPRSSKTKHHARRKNSRNQVQRQISQAPLVVGNTQSNPSLNPDVTPLSSRAKFRDENVERTQQSVKTDKTQKKRHTGGMKLLITRSPETGNPEQFIPKVDHTQDDVAIDRTQSDSRELVLRSRKSVMDLLNNYSKRVRYTKKLDEKGITLNDDPIMNDKTIRDEKRFLKRIERCKFRKLQRICVCPLTKCYRLTDRFDHFKTVFHRFCRIFWIACCPPLCCIIPRVAFWPPRCEYYFFEPPKNDTRIDVRNDQDAILMKRRKRGLKKYRKAIQCSLSDRYRFGMSHPCANDVDHVEGFVLNTSRKKRIACIYIPCPDGNPRFTMIYSHPNGSDLSDHLVGVPSLVDIARFYRCDLYSYDYTGYGISQGSPAELDMYSDISAVYTYVTVAKGVPAKRVILLGYSIGSAVTVELLKREKPAGAILQAPPTSILRVLKQFVGKNEDMKGLGRESCCLDRFRTIDKLKFVQVPILVIHGVNDRTVPIEHGKLICQRAVNKVTPSWVQSAGHDNIENCKEVWIRIRQFVRTELGLEHH